MEISVLIPAYNAERFVAACVESLLAQTYEDFEIIVVNDCSTDRTLEILDRITDPRLRILSNERNLGVVGALNRAMSVARGRYIARIDSDDLATPTRFAKQKAFLDAHPEIALLATEMSVLKDDRVVFNRTRGDADPLMVRWMLHLDNPVGCPSMMFRADAVHRLGTYMSEGMRYAEDFDFSHRILQVGDISVLPEHLTIYRHHDLNMTRVHRDKVEGRAEAVLSWVYEKLFGAPVPEGVRLVGQHILNGRLVEGIPEWDRLRAFLDQLQDRFCEQFSPGPAQLAGLHEVTSRYWDRMVHRSLSAGRLREGWHARSHRPNGVGPTSRFALSSGTGLLRSARPIVRAAKDIVTRPHSTAAKSFALDKVAFRSAPAGREQPPTLYVVIDTEAEFDWTKPIDREETRVSASASQHLAQAIFDGHGIRPIYVVDYAIASQPEGYRPLRAIMEDHRCVIGAHLHPWTTPPFEEEVSERNSFAGNLPPGLEEQKIRVLVAEIERSFGIKPLFYKSGRYGLSAATLDVLDRLGFQVDFSILPQADLRAKGGPDFRAADTVSYRVPGNSVLSIPMSRGQTGLLAPVPRRLHNVLHSAAAVRMRLPALLSRSGLLNTVTLTPEGMTVPEQIGLLRAMERRGHRTFVLHYHSPSLGGFTPYVRDAGQLEAFLENIRAVCGFFLGPFGGMPGNPADLVPPAMREMIWPARPVQAVAPEPVGDAIRPG